MDLTAAEVDEVDRTLSAVLPPGSLFAVGGRVRDEFRSSLDGQPRPHKDLDYVAVGLTLDELISRLQKVGRAELVGASFAVVKWFGGGLSADVALPRRERSTGVAHRAFAIEAMGPEVPLEDDLSRRDFRMNMLARALPGGLIVDPYGGEADIRARRVDVLREEAFAEDPLRMLRAAQFAARFEFELSERSSRAMSVAAPLVATLSAQRIRDELIKLLVDAPEPSRGLEILRTSGVLAYVLPELLEGLGVEQNEWHAHDVYRHTMHVLDATPRGGLELRLAALLHDIAKPRCKAGPTFHNHDETGAKMSAEILTRLAFSKDTVDTVAALVAHHLYLADPLMKPATVRRFVRRVGRDRLELQFSLRAADIIGTGRPLRDDANARFEEHVREVLAEQAPMSLKDLAIDGHDVRGILAGAGQAEAPGRGDRRIGRLLGLVLERVLDEPNLTREAQLKIVEEAATQSPTSAGDER